MSILTDDPTVAVVGSICSAVEVGLKVIEFHLSTSTLASMDPRPLARS
jgi:hypothetical protein